MSAAGGAGVGVGVGGVVGVGDGVFVGLGDGLGVGVGGGVLPLLEPARSSAILSTLGDPIPLAISYPDVAGK